MTTRLLTFILICSAGTAFSQGLSFSYLIPQDGYLSAPVSPFSVRGVGIGNRFGVETGFTLYHIPGLGLDKMPFTYDQPLTGPHFAVLLPLETFFTIPARSFSVSLYGGGFLWWNINTRINEGNMDRAFRAYRDWEVLNTDFTLDDKLGFGWMTGLEVKVTISDDLSVSLGARYLSGGAKVEIDGTYSGGSGAGPIQTESFATDEAEMKLKGVELSVGVQFTSR